MRKGGWVTKWQKNLKEYKKEPLAGEDSSKAPGGAFFCLLKDEGAVNE